MTDQLLSLLVPMLTDRPKAQFNIFDVMHHGVHEKQLSNVFAWLLQREGTHGLGDAFQRILVAEVNRELGLLGREPIGDDSYSVRQEVNTSPADRGQDIADIVLEGGENTIVVENYWTSDGHGHGYANYLNYGARTGNRSVVVLLCEMESRTTLADGWEKAPVVLYRTLIDNLWDHVQQQAGYKTEQPHQYYFIENMHRHFTDRMALNMNREGLVELIDAMCKGDEAGRYGAIRQDEVARNFGDVVRGEAIQRYDESRELLGRIKHQLRDYCANTLRSQLHEALRGDVYGVPKVPWAGIWQWTVVWDTSAQDESPHDLRLMFGPSAWGALRPPEGIAEEPLERLRANPDFTRVHVFTRSGKVVRSDVSLTEVLEGPAPDDFRLRDEILSLLEP